MGIAALQIGDDPQRLFVVIEAAVIFHQAVQRRFAGMPEGRVTEIMGKADRLHQVLVPP